MIRNYMYLIVKRTVNRVADWVLKNEQFVLFFPSWVVNPLLALVALLYCDSIGCV